MAIIPNGNEWQVLKNKVNERCEYLLLNETWADCLFLVGAEPDLVVFKAHRLIMAMSSPVFGAMFFGPLAAVNDTIRISDIQPAVFEALLKYIYFDSFYVADVDIAVDLYYAAKKYIIPDLGDKCMSYIRFSLTPAIACKIYEFSTFIDELELSSSCLKMISEKTEEILTDPSVGDISLETWLVILDCDELNVKNECVLLESFQTWTKQECQRKGLLETQDNLRSVSGLALQKFRFLSLSPKEFANGPAKSPLLLQSESHAILVNLLADDNWCPLPPGFSTITHKRRNISLGSRSKQNEVAVKCPYDLIVHNEFIQTFSSLDDETEFGLFLTVKNSVLIRGIVIKATEFMPSFWGDFLKGDLIDSDHGIVASLRGNTPVVPSTYNKIKFAVPLLMKPHKGYFFSLRVVGEGDAPVYNSFKSEIFEVSLGSSALTLIYAIIFSEL